MSDLSPEGERPAAGVRAWPTRAVVLAAGRGRRLRPYTDQQPKPLLELDGVCTLDASLAALSAAGIETVCIVVDYLARQIINHAGDGRAWGLSVTYRRQAGWPGSAGALRAAAGWMDGPSLVLAADYFLPRNFLKPLLSAYVAGGRPLAVSLRPLPAAETAQRSSVRFDRHGRIVEIVEKPAPGQAPSTVGASLIYVVPAEIKAFLDYPTRSRRGEYELPAVINAMLRAGYTITGVRQDAPGEWRPPGHDRLVM